MDNLVTLLAILALGGIAIGLLLSWREARRNERKASDAAVDFMLKAADDAERERLTKLSDSELRDEFSALFDTKVEK